MVQRNLDQVIIRDLELLMSIGIYDHEKAQKQCVIVNIVLDVVSNKGKSVTSIDEVVSYEEIVNAVQHLANEGHIDLVETFAEDISDICLKDDKVLSADICIEKPDIIKGSKSVGVRIVRAR